MFLSSKHLFLVQNSLYYSPSLTLYQFMSLDQFPLAFQFEILLEIICHCGDRCVISSVFREVCIIYQVRFFFQARIRQHPQLCLSNSLFSPTFYNSLNIFRRQLCNLLKFTQLINVNHFFFFEPSFSGSTPELFPSLSSFHR